MADLILQKKVSRKIQDLTKQLINAQEKNGTWHFCFESGTLTDAYMIILLCHLDIKDEKLINQLARRILSKQDVSGAWKLFYDEPEGDLSATIECYYALLLTGLRQKDHPDMIRARNFILSRSGLPRAASLTKVMLALTGHYEWVNLPKIPPAIILLSKQALVNFYDIVGYARVHAAPEIICANKKYVLKLSNEPDLSDLTIPSAGQPSVPQVPQVLLDELKKNSNNLSFSTKSINDLAIKQLEYFMLDRLEWDGTLYSYFTSTFLMIFALLALGYGKDHPVITKAVNGLISMVWCTSDSCHQQETTSTVWDTALIAYALQQGNLPYNHPAIVNAAAYLTARQQDKYGDWRFHNPQGRPGGWGFSDSNTINPDTDDTSYSLRALYQSAVNNPESYNSDWQAGLEWLLTMQNKDGGWPAFEKNTNKKWLKLFPQDAQTALADPSSADLTGRALELLGNYAGMSLPKGNINKGVNWLLKNQRSDGAWFGRWGIAYIYGTWAAISGLVAVGVDRQHPTIVKAVNWLLGIQNPDGGWGESCLSDIMHDYRPLGFSTISQTAWAIDAMIIAGLKQTSAVTRGINVLLELLEQTGINSSYPTGAGLPGGFYIHYHSYRYVWPLVTLSHYLAST